MKKIIIALTASVLFVGNARSQGCIAIRNISGFGQYNFTDNAFSTSNWRLNIANRYFKSFREFNGTTEVKSAKEDEIIHHIYTMDISVLMLMEKGWSLALSVPFSSNTRSTSTDHGGPGQPRHSIHAFGIGDLRFTAYKWLIKPNVHQNANVQLGLGIKLPTGDYRYQDYYYRKEDSAVLTPISIPIQLDDGGTGIITELNTFYIFDNHRLILEGNFYYLFNPRDQNGVSTTLGRIPTALQIKSTQNIASVADQFALRVGATYKFNKLALSGAIRYEGQPVYDLIGNSNGNRRAGYNLSIEPGIIYTMKKISLYAYIPVIVGREIKQNVPEKRITEWTGVNYSNPGGFANYLVFVGASFKL